MQALFGILLSGQSKIHCPMSNDLPFAIAYWFERYGDEFLGHE